LCGVFQDRLGFVYSADDIDGSWYNLPAVELLVFEAVRAARGV
jgi:hypothetical protein